MRVRHAGIRPAATIMAGLLAASCSAPAGGGDGSAFAGRVTLTGSSTIAPLAGELAKRFESEHAGIRVDVQAGGSSRGIADVRRGTADVGMVSRSLTADEADLTATAIALDGIGLIVHRDNPVERLSDRQIIDIYTGRVTNWAEVGGADGAITVVNKADGRATLDLFVSQFALDPASIRAQIVIGDNQHGIRTVGGDPNAIGYVSIGTADFEISRGAAIRMLPMDDVAPTLDNVRNGSFPLARELNLVTRGPRTPQVEAFVAFAASAAARDLVERQFFVTVSD